MSHWCLGTKFASEAILHIDNIFIQTVILHAEYSYDTVSMQVLKYFKKGEALLARRGEIKG